jgi:hypothetical protein
LRAKRGNLALVIQDKLRNLALKEINNFEIATSQKTLLAMTVNQKYRYSEPIAVIASMVPHLSLRAKRGNLALVVRDKLRKL